MLSDARPIAAIATPAGRGGIGVVRLSGRDLAPVIEAVCARALEPRHATLIAFRAADGSAIDQGLAIHFPAPHSYTGEDVLELHGHGGPVVMQMLLARVLEAGRAIEARLAAPGEFTLRAFLNDKLDLAQAEAVADLIDASTEAAARSAARSLEGAFSSQVHALVEAVIRLRTLVEATLDFPEEEIDFLQASDALGQLEGIVGRLETLLDSASQGALLRSGLNVVLVGQPNVGKSSLLNALAGAEVAIVTDIAGTTRDRVAQAIQIEGIPLNVIDTAGLREAAEVRDEVERIGIDRTWDAVQKADVILHLREATAPDTPMDAQIAERLPAGVPVVAVYNKVDLLASLWSGVMEPVRSGQGASGSGATASGAHAVPVGTDRAAESLRTGAPGRSVWISAKFGTGIEALRRVLLEIAGWHASGETVILARDRHLTALRSAQAHLVQAQAHARAQAERLELFAEELRLAQQDLNTITGEFTADDLLGEIFGRFCIGK
ncbi:MAG: tRNA uridine-5-carboxymethylaminomethyl(34) synthesis GTPase MnmE [Burkholderiales bacterium]|nr:MAG: tRNA uridine-5-carboxymethylaminomethyl(34) synthesis GTPase MnmE [Burkholderiales bacterium]